jgi:hypothetical protein
MAAATTSSPKISPEDRFVEHLRRGGAHGGEARGVALVEVAVLALQPAGRLLCLLGARQGLKERTGEAILDRGLAVL